MKTADRNKMLQEIDQVIARGPYQDNWESLSQYETPEWYKAAKFGIFIHWGAYAVPAYRNEWYPRNMYIEGTPEYEHHIKTYGPHKQFGYKDFIPLFKAEHFDPDAWAALFAQAGAQYVIPVAEHHDGFQMYKSELSDWNAYDKGPHRDTTGELRAALQKRGIPMGVSSHRFEHWFFLGGGRKFDSDLPQLDQPYELYWPSVDMPDDFNNSTLEPAPTPDYCEDWLLRSCELVERFQPAVVYFDWWIHHSALRPYLKKFAAYYYDRAVQKGYPAAIHYKLDPFPFGSAVLDVERGHFAQAKPFFWQTCTAIAKNSWCYTLQNEYKTPYTLICDLIDVVSKNGTMLLNVGPKADGTIGPEDTAVLRAIGAWLKINGEAIYGSRVWRTSGEGPTAYVEGSFAEKDIAYTPADIRFTVNHGGIYAAVLSWPADGKITIQAMNKGGPREFQGLVRDVSILGYDEKPLWTRDQDGMHVTAPFVKSDLPVVIRITVD